jgi:UDP:flavonoid glycosyltransferase YjiC (YdhE family)
MASILIVTRGLPSVVYQSVELARRLAAAGHRLTFAGDAGARPLVEHHGLAFLGLDPDRFEQFLEDDAATAPPSSASVTSAAACCARASRWPSPRSRGSCASNRRT